jgi:hypothetical protein
MHIEPLTDPDRGRLYDLLRLTGNDGDLCSRA